MPITKSAIKKLRVDKIRTQVNLRMKKRYKKAIKRHLTEKTLETLKLAYSLIDRAVKKHIIHKNKAARLKSQVAKIVSLNQTKDTKVKAKTAKTKTAKTKKTTVKKTVKAKTATKAKKPQLKKIN